MGYIYRIRTKDPDEPVYVGQSRAVRFASQDPDYLGSGVGISDYIQTHGTGNLIKEILHDGVENQDELDTLEKEEIERLAADNPRNWNRARGGAGHRRSEAERLADEEADEEARLLAQKEAERLAEDKRPEGSIGPQLPEAVLIMRARRDPTHLYRRWKDELWFPDASVMRERWDRIIQIEKDDMAAADMYLLKGNPVLESVREQIEERREALDVTLPRTAGEWHERLNERIEFHEWADDLIRNSDLERALLHLPIPFKRAPSKDTSFWVSFVVIVMVLILAVLAFAG